MHGLLTAAGALLAAAAGLLLTAANRWGAATLTECRDTFTTVVAMCAAPVSPWWALGLGAVVPAATVLLLGYLLAQRTRQARTADPRA